ncbi:hypothetical protein [Nostoc sp. PCC 7524]|nr:hypothetical protein [Nostoc sp. PCC 7524]
MNFRHDAVKVSELAAQLIGSWQLLVILAGGRQRAEGRRQKSEE